MTRSLRQLALSVLVIAGMAGVAACGPVAADSASKGAVRPPWRPGPRGS